MPAPEPMHVLRISTHSQVATTTKRTTIKRDSLIYKKITAYLGVILWGILGVILWCQAWGYYKH